VPADPHGAHRVEARTPVSVVAPHSLAALALARVAEWPPLECARTASPFYERALKALR
jgi:hypothetical protein